MSVFNNRVPPSVAAPNDTNLSDTTVWDTTTHEEVRRVQDYSEALTCTHQ